MSLKDLIGAFTGATGMMELPLSSQASGYLEDLIIKGIFDDKADFIDFASKAFSMYKDTCGSGSFNPDCALKVVSKFALTGLTDSDMAGQMMPLVTEVFKAAINGRIRL
jgi:hypothetical protein